MMEGIEQINEWQGRYKGIPYEVRQWEMAHVGVIWNYYIYIDLSELDSEVARKLWLRAKKSRYGGECKYYSPNSCDLLDDVEMHGGITYYSKLYGGNDNKMIKLGCDFSHLGDNYTKDDLDAITADIRNCIDNLPKHLKGVKK